MRKGLTEEQRKNTILNLTLRLIAGLMVGIVVIWSIAVTTNATLIWLLETMILLIVGVMVVYGWAVLAIHML